MLITSIINPNKALGTLNNPSLIIIIITAYVEENSADIIPPSLIIIMTTFIPPGHRISSRNQTDTASLRSACRETIGTSPLITPKKPKFSANLPVLISGNSI